MNSQPSRQTTQDEVDEFLTTQSGSEGEARLLHDAPKLRNRYLALKTAFPDELFDRIASKPEKRNFGIFNREDSKRVAELFPKLIKLADDAKEDKGLDLAINAAKIIAGTDNIALAKYVLMLFIVHHRQGRELNLPAYALRHSESLQRSQTRQITSSEDSLNWFREDLFLNEHHEHWHAVYGWFDDNSTLKDRQGELFLYMHQQMLARYNTERLTAKLPEVFPFPQKHFDEPICEGYDPGLLGYGCRWPTKSIEGLVYPTIQTLKDWAGKLDQDIKDGIFGKESNPEDALGAAISISNHIYGDLHRDVHQMLANIVDTNWIMADASFSANDPVFYRWHKYIDDKAFAFQETQAANALAEDAPSVLIRSQPQPSAISQSSDIILSLNYQLEKARKPDQSLEQLGECLFGGAHWDTDFSEQTATTTNELYTWTDVLPVVTKNNGEPTKVSYLDQAFEYTYFIRVQNLASEPQDVTVRIWLVAKDDLGGKPLYENRRMWIEMDTFQVHLLANTQKVICRPAKFSSVIRKSAGVGVRPRTLTPSLAANHSEKNSDAYCDCGWPYTLLLPKGTHAGMDFRLMVMFTKHDIDMQGAESSCGSVSLCGLWDLKYPDGRKMGYPFNRPFPHANNIERTIFEQPNMAARDFRIKYLG